MVDEAAGVHGEKKMQTEASEEGRGDEGSNAGNEGGKSEDSSSDTASWVATAAV